MIMMFVVVVVVMMQAGHAGAAVGGPTPDAVGLRSMQILWKAHTRCKCCTQITCIHLACISGRPHQPILVTAKWNVQQQALDMPPLESLTGTMLFRPPLGPTPPP